jgi:hypothetical protein
VDRLGAERLELVDVLDAEDGEGRRGEAVAAGVLRGAGFAFGGAGSGGADGIGAIGGEALLGYGFLHAASEIARRQAGV